MTMLGLDMLLPPLPPLRLNRYPHGFRIHTQDRSPALKQALVDMRRPLHGEVAAAEDAGSIQAQDVAGQHAWHAGREADHIPFLHKIGETVDVDGYVVSWLGG